MRKFTLSLLMAATSLVASAQDASGIYWNKDLTVTEQASDLYRKAPMAMDDFGNTYVTGTHTKDLDFSSSYLQPIATSAFMAKYDYNGKEQWAAGLKGAATITSIATDEDGYVYVTGTFADAVDVLSKDGQSYQTIHGMEGHDDQVSAFIVKYNKDGYVLAVKTIIPEVTMTDVSYWWAEPAFTPKKIQVVGDRVVLAASYKTDCKIDDNLTLKGQYYYNADFGMTGDVANMGVISLSKDLADAELLVKLGTRETASVNYGPEDVNFAADGNDIYVAFVAWGKDLYLEKESSSVGFDLDTREDGEQTLYEHAWIVLKANERYINTMKMFRSVPTDNEAKFNTIDDMQCKDGNIYLAGTYNVQFPFSPYGETYSGNNDSYLVCLSEAKDLEQLWAVRSNYEDTANKEDEVVTGFAFAGDEIKLCTRIEDMSSHKTNLWRTYTIDSKGQLLDGEGEMPAAALVQKDGRIVVQSNNKDTEDAEGTYSFICMDDFTTGIANVSKDATSDNSNAIIYNLDGAQVGKGKAALNSLQKGVYVIKNGNEAKKIIK